jgi:predicted metal-dependent HD superfamily phosphohydrolase
MSDNDVRNLVADMPALVRALLVERFTDSPLAYHTLDHILHLLDALETAFARDLSARDHRILRYAIWLHDLFYDPMADDNERRSADIGLALLQWPEDELRDFEICVMATKGNATDHPLARIMVDLDLSILAADRGAYRRYALAIRDEYSMHPEPAYRAGRIAVLDQLCAVPLLHRLSAARGLGEGALEQRARANMRWEQDRLREDGPIVELLARD